MATRSLGRLTLDLVLQTGNFAGALDQASRRTKRSATNMAKDFANIGKSVAGMGAAVAGAVAGITLFTKAAADNAREIQVFSGLANTTVEEFQRWAFATQTVGIEQDKLSDILKDVNDRVGDFLTTGGGEMADFFERIAPIVGVTAEEFRNLSGPQALQLFISSLEKANLSQAEMVFFLESMANDATALIPLLRDNGEELNRLAQEAEALGIVMSDLDIAQLEDFGQQFERMQAIVKGLTNTIAVEFAPILAEVADRISDAAVEAGGFDVIVRSAVETAARGFARVADVIHDVRLASASVRVATVEMELAFATFAQNSWTSVRDFFQNFIDATNAARAAVSTLPFVDIPPIESTPLHRFVSRLEDRTEAAMFKAWRAREAFAALAEAPRPSESIADFFEDVDKRREELIKKIKEDGGLIPGQTRKNQKETEEDAKASASALGEQSREAERLAQSMQGLVDRLFPAAAAQRQFSKDSELLDLAGQAGLVDDLSEAHRRLNNEMARELTGGFIESIATGGILEESASNMEEWLAAAERAFTDFDALAASTSTNVTQSFGQGFVQAISQAESFKDAFTGIIQSVAQSFLQAVGEMIAQWLLFQAVTAGFGGFGGGGGIFSGLAGFFDRGGRIPAGQFGIVGERGPEIVMGPADVVGRDDTARMFGGPQSGQLDVNTGGVTINQIEDRSRAGQVQERESTDGRRNIDVFVADIFGDGPRSQAIRQKFNLTPAGR